MAGKTIIFVSSTCFDLRQVRDDLRIAIESLGHEPLLSEHSSFPVNPSADTIENCKEVIRKHADMLVLIVGHRSGSTDPETGKSIVNSEYDTAQREGIERFVFVQRAVWETLPIWRDNPEADFSSRVEQSAVFEFVDHLASDSNWIFSFDTAADIMHVLKTQLSVYLKELIGRAREGKLSPLPEFAGESERARSLALDQPPYWEYLLTVELLSPRLDALRSQFEDVRRGVIFKKARSINQQQYFGWQQARLHDSVVLMEAMKTILEQDLMSSWGDLGVSGSATEIKNAVDRLTTAFEELVSWELEVRSVKVPNELERLKNTMGGWAEHLFRQAEHIPVELANIFEEEEEPHGEYNIMLTITAPDGIEDFLKEVERLKRELL